MSEPLCLPSLAASWRQGLWVRCLAILLVGALLACHPAAVAAQGGPGDLWQTYRDGLLSADVSAVLPAQDGSIWFGTERGASRYNGEWTSLASGSVLPAGRVRALAQGEDGAIWFGLSAGGLARRAADGTCCTVWTTREGLPSNDVRALSAAAGGRMWVATALGPVYVEGDKILKDASAPAVPLWALAQGKDGVLYAAGDGQDIWRRSPEGAWQAVGGVNVLPGPFYSLWVGADGKVWAGAENGLAVFANGAWQRFPLLTDDQGLRVFAVVQDREGGLWVGTDQGGFYDADALPSTPAVHLDVQHGLTNDHVRAMAFDSDGALWLGTIAGASRYAGHIWQLIDAPGVTGHRINVLMTDSAGRTWAGTEGYGLALWNGKEWRLFTAAEAGAGGLPDARIVALFEDSHKRVWAGTGAGAAYWGDDNRWHALNIAQGLADGPIWSIAEGADGVLYFGTSTGAVRWDGASDFRKVAELDQKRVNAIHRSQDGTLWFGTEANGLLAFDGSAWRTVTGGNGTGGGGPSFASVVLNGIAESPDRTLWVGTYDAGLWSYAAGQWKQVESMLASPRVLAVSWSSDSVWAGTSGGLVRTDNRTVQAYAGLVLPRPEVSAVAPGLDGSCWIGTYGGLVHYRPEKTTPWIRVASVNLAEPQPGAVSLRVGDPLSVRLSGGDAATQPETLQYLVEVEDSGLPAQVSRSGLVSLSAAGLPQGQYTLRAWARDGAFNYSAPAEVKIDVVRPPASATGSGGDASRGGILPPIETSTVTTSTQLAAVVLTTTPAATSTPGSKSSTGSSSLFFAGVFLGLVGLGGLSIALSMSWRSRVREREQEAAAEARREEALERHFNPYIAGEPVREPDMFFGRQEVMRNILNALHQNNIMVVGERRIGKTTLLYHLAQALREANDQEWVFIPVSIDLEGTSEAHFFHWLMENIAGVLRAYLLPMPGLRFRPTGDGEYTDHDFTADLWMLIGALKQIVAPRSLRVILLMDEVDIVGTYDHLVQQRLRRVFMGTLAGNLGAVVAGVHIGKAWDRVESPWFNLFNEVALDPFPDEVALQLLREPVSGIYAWDDDALQLVLAHAHGRPHRLQQYGMESVNHMLADMRTRVTLADVEAAEEALKRNHLG